MLIYCLTVLFGSLGFIRHIDCTIYLLIVKHSIVLTRLCFSIHNHLSSSFDYDESVLINVYLFPFIGYSYPSSIVV